MTQLLFTVVVVLTVGLLPLAIELLLHWRMPRVIAGLAHRGMRSFRLVGRPMRSTQENDGYRDTVKASGWPGGPLAGPAQLSGDDGVVLWIEEGGAAVTVHGPGRLGRPGPFPSTLRLDVQMEEGALSVRSRRLPAPLSTYFLLPVGVLPLVLTDWMGSLGDEGAALGPLFYVAILLAVLGIAGHVWRQLAELSARLAAEHTLAEAERALSRYLAEVAERESELAP